MPRLTPTKRIEIDGTSPISLDVAAIPVDYELYSTGIYTLVSNIAIQASGTPVQGMSYNFRYTASLDLNGNSLNFFGVSDLPVELQDKQCEITAYYDGTKWVIKFKADWEEDDTILQRHLSDDVVGNNELADMPALSIKGNATLSSADPQDLVFASGQIASADAGGLTLTTPSGDLTFNPTTGVWTVAGNVIDNTKAAQMAIGTVKVSGGTGNDATDMALADAEFIAGDSATTEGLKAISMSGDATMDKNGVVTINQSNIKEIELLIPSASLLASNTTPITIIPAPGAGKVIDIISAFGHLVWNSVAYTTNLQLELRAQGAAVAQWINPQGILSSTTSTIKHFERDSAHAATTSQLVANAAIELATDVGDPAAGDSDAKFYISYRIVTL